MKTSSSKQVETIILGAGITGLTLAHYLNKKNKKCLILESKSRVGGNIITEKNQSFTCENGPNTILLNKKSVVELIREIGLEKKIIFPNDNNKKRFLLKKGKLTPIPQNFYQFLKTNLISLRSKIRILSEIFIPKHKHNISVKKFIKNRFGSEFEKVFIEPFLTGVYAGETDKMSAKHVLSKIWNLEQNNGSVLIGAIRQRNKGNNLRSFNFKNGLTDFISAINKRIKSNVKLNSEVTSIRKLKDGYDVTVNNKISYKCKNIISTIPAFGLAEVIFNKKISNALKNINYCPILVLHFGLEKKHIKENIDGFGVLTKKNDNMSFLGVLFNSRIFPHVAPKNNDLITVMIGGARQSKLINKDRSKLKNTVIKQIRKMISYNGRIVMEKEFLWRNGIPQYDLKHTDLIKCISEFEKKYKNFYISGNYHNGISVSDCIDKAYSLSKRL